jgi:hypothetical protein
MAGHGPDDGQQLRDNDRNVPYGFDFFEPEDWRRSGTARG